jgi:hypothetical protein
MSVFVMRSLALTLLSVNILFFSEDTFAQEQEQNEKFSKFLKLTIDFTKFDSRNYHFNNWQPAYVWSRNTTMHELGITEISVSKKLEVAEYYIRGFDFGLRYLYKYKLPQFFGALIPMIGVSASADYYGSHAEPIRPTVHKEFYLNALTCSLYANAALSYQVNSKFIIDCDFPFSIWSVRFFRQRDILPITKERRVLSGQDFYSPPEYYFNFRIGARYRIM